MKRDIGTGQFAHEREKTLLKKHSGEWRSKERRVPLRNSNLRGVRSREHCTRGNAHENKEQMFQCELSTGGGRSTTNVCFTW